MVQQSTVNAEIGGSSPSSPAKPTIHTDMDGCENLRYKDNPWLPLDEQGGLMSGLALWAHGGSIEDFWGTDRTPMSLESLRPERKDPTLWDRLQYAWNAFKYGP